MAGNRLSDAGANALLDIILSAQASTFPSTWYFALVTTAPTDDIGTGMVEVNAGGYARVGLAANLTNFPSASQRSKTNAVDIQWPTATASWGDIVGVALFDAASTGTYLGYGALATSVAVGLSGAPKLVAGAFTLTA